MQTETPPAPSTLSDRDPPWSLLPTPGLAYVGPRHFWNKDGTQRERGLLNDKIRPDSRPCVSPPDPPGASFHFSRTSASAPWDDNPSPFPPTPVSWEVRRWTGFAYRLVSRLRLLPSHVGSSSQLRIWSPRVRDHGGPGDTPPPTSTPTLQTDFPVARRGLRLSLFPSRFSTRLGVPTRGVGRRGRGRRWGP